MTTPLRNKLNHTLMSQVLQASKRRYKKFMTSVSPIPVCRLQGHVCMVSNFVHLPNDGRVISGNLDKTIRIWEPVSNKFKCIQILNGHKAGVFCLCELVYNIFAGDSMGTTIRIWEEKKWNLKCISILTQHKSRVPHDAYKGLQASNSELVDIIIYKVQKES